MKKRFEPFLRAGLLLLLCLALGFSFLNLQKGEPQRQEQEPASRMLLSDAELLYDADNLKRLDNANDNQQTEPSTEPEEPSTEPSEAQTEQPGQTEQPEETAPPQDQPEDPIPTPDDPGDVPAEEPVTTPGRTNIGDLLDISGSGGGSGGQTPSREPSEEPGSSEVGDPDRYFETSIIDGDTVDYSDYTFTIRHLKPLLKVRGLTVIVNGEELSFRAASTSVMIRLAEGTNTIVVRVAYFDGTDNIIASRAYTVSYSPAGETVIVAYRAQDSTPLSELHSTAESGLRFVAYGLRDRLPLRAAVRLNGKTVTSSSDTFDVTLQFGTNVIEVSASDRVGSASETYRIDYREDGFKITTSFSDTVIDNDTKQPQHISEELPLYLDSEEFRFRFYLNQETGKEQITQVRYDDNLLQPSADGWYTVQVDTRRPKYLLLRYLDADGERQSYKWTVRFHRNPGTTPPDKYPSIAATIEVGDTVIGLEDGLVLKSPDIITVIDARSWNNEQLYLNNYEVYINGTRIESPCSQTGASFGYNTYLSIEGANTITVTATDEDGYSVTRSWTVYYEKGDVTVTVSVEATTVGLGYLIPPTQVTVPGGTDVLTIIRDLLEENGYTCSASSYYLASIGKPGINNGYSIDPELKQIIIEDGMDALGAGDDPRPASMDSLGEFDYYRWSGWMYSYNGRYPGYGMNACKPQDGAVIRVRFTLALGKDIGGFSPATGGNYGNSNGNYYKEW